MLSVQDVLKKSSPRPWSYHERDALDWIEDSAGLIVVEAPGAFNGRLIVAMVNRLTEWVADGEEAVAALLIAEETPTDGEA